MRAVAMGATGTYGREFYEDLVGTSGPSAARIVPMVLDLAEVRSVVDVGCGIGAWLDAFRRSGVDDVFGVDGDWVARDQLVIPQDRFAARELGEPFELGRRFDLAICLEVAEHLDEKLAGKLVEELCRLAPIVLFSAAIPHQGGLGHVNEQWPAWWADLFARAGYRPVDALRLPIWQDDSVAWWYRQNIMLYAGEDALSANPKLAAAERESVDTPLPLVHPEMYRDVLRRASTPIARQISRKMRRTVRGWFGRS